MDSRKQELLEARFQGSPAFESAAVAAAAVVATAASASARNGGGLSLSSSQSQTAPNPDASLSNPPPLPPVPNLPPPPPPPLPPSVANNNSQSLPEASSGTFAASRTPGKAPRKRRAPDGSGGGGGSGDASQQLQQLQQLQQSVRSRKIEDFYPAKPSKLQQPQPQLASQLPSLNNLDDDNSSSRSSDGMCGGGGGGSGGPGAGSKRPGKRKKLLPPQPPQQQGGSSSPPQKQPPPPEPPAPPQLQNSGSDSCSQQHEPSIALPNQPHPPLPSDSQPQSQQQQLLQPPPPPQQPQLTLQEQLASLQKQRDDLERQVASQQRLIDSLRESQERGREILRQLLAEKSRSERRSVRERCRENRLRLGQFQIVRHGSDLEDRWFDGWAFEEVHRKRQEIEQGKERIEKERRLWMKRKPPAAGSTPKSSSSRSTSAGKQQQQQSEVDADEFFTQLEIYDIHKQALIKDEKDLRDEVEKLDRERNVHIREMKRIQNEDSSRFKCDEELHKRYVLLSLLGKGGFSEVHKAYDLTEHRFVACKIHQLSASWPKEKKDNYIRHAVREIEIHKTLQHPRIVKVYDVFDIDSDSFCTVLEYSKGCDLDFFLKQNKSMPEREARNIICQVVSALKYLNQRRPPVIHYDLKPGNILLGEGDSVADIKLTDFGLSKVMTEDKFQADSGMDLTSQGAGTYWYLPPECFETGPEAPKISSKVDVWSVGVIFYQCLYGQKPFGNNMSQADILRNHTILKALKIDFPQSTPGNSKVSEQAKNFIRRCVTYDKHQRPDVFVLAEEEYLKSKAQLKFDTTTGAGGAGFAPSSSSSTLPSGGGNASAAAWALMLPPPS